MIRDDIIRMAREAGICTGNSILLPAPDGQIEALERFAALATAEKNKEIERLREVLNKLEYFCDGTIRRYPDEHEVEVALRREEQ
jgi:hypothetical protein